MIVRKTLTALGGLYDGANRAYSDSNPPETLMMTEFPSAVSTPAAGKIVLYSPDGTALLFKDDAGVVRTMGGGTKVSDLPAITMPVSANQIPINDGGTTKKITLAQLDSYIGPDRGAATAAQGPGFATDTYVTASRRVFPQARMQAGVVYRSRMVFTKTGAGTAAPVFQVRTGVNGTTADTSRLSYTGAAQTAVIDTAYLEFQCTFRVVGASAVLASWLRFDHDLATTGFATATRGFQGQSVSGTFDSTTASMGIGVSVNGGASAAWTLQQCYSELVNLAN